MSDIGKYEDRLYAEMSTFAYVDVHELDVNKEISYETPVPVADLGGPEYLEGWSVAEVINDNDNSGVYAVVFVNEESKDAVIAFRGSEPPWKPGFDMVDYMTDWYYADLKLLNNEETRYQEALREIMADPERIEYLKEYNCIDLTGHSLGSNSAIVSYNDWFHSEDTDLVSKLGDCIAFDGPGGSNEFIEANPELADCEGRIVQYRWSLVGHMFDKLPGVTYVTVEVNTFQRWLFINHPIENLKFDEEGNVIEYTGRQSDRIFVAKECLECIDFAPSQYGQFALVYLSNITMKLMLIVVEDDILEERLEEYCGEATFWTEFLLVVWKTYLVGSISSDVLMIIASIILCVRYTFGKIVITNVQNALIEAKIYTEEQLALLFNAVEKYLCEAIPFEQIIGLFTDISAEIIVDTVKAEVYRERLQRIKSQISSLSGQLGGISSHYGLLDLGGLLNGAFLTRHLWKIDANIAYLNSVIDSFESAENRLKVLTT